MPSMKIQQDKKSRSPKNLSSVTVASTDLFKIQPIFARETKAGDIFNIQHAQLSICDALQVPSFVRVKNRNNWFYVPFCKVWQAFESMLGGTTISVNQASGYKVSQVPVLSPLTLMYILINEQCVSDYSSAPSVYDFRIQKSANVYQYFVFTAKGRRVWNILQGLGYKLQMFHSLNSGVATPTTAGVAPSALPLFCYAKLYAENFVPSKYADKCNELITMMYNFQGTSVPSSLTYTFDGSGNISGVSIVGPDTTYLSLLSKMVNLFSTVYYGDDYFTSSPNEAVASPDGLNIAQNFADITVPSTVAHSSVDSQSALGYTPVHQGVQANGNPASNPFNVTDYIHNMLRQVTKNIQLKAIAGSKLSQRLYALYGNKSQTYNMEAVMLDQTVNALDVKSITSVADTELSGGASLGQKGGQLNGYGDGKHHFEFTEFGMLICVNQIIPVYFYGEGMHREMMHITPDDFYNDRYALAGYQNIGRFELFNDDQLGYYQHSNMSPAGSFGKTGAYAEYALRKDTLIGDFALLSRKAGLDCYHFNRDLVSQLYHMSQDTTVANLTSLPNNNSTFLEVVDSLPGVTGHVYDRIFVDSTSTDDHIIQYNEFKVTADRYGRDINNFTIGEADGHETELAGLGKVLYN